MRRVRCLVTRYYVCRLHNVRNNFLPKRVHFYMTLASHRWRQWRTIDLFAGRRVQLCVTGVRRDRGRWDKYRTVHTHTHTNFTLHTLTCISYIYTYIYLESKTDVARFSRREIHARRIHIPCIPHVVLVAAIVRGNKCWRVSRKVFSGAL